ILRSLNFRLGQARANVVFFDVQGNQRGGIDSIIRASRLELIDETPIVPMRVASINSRPVADILADLERQRVADSVRGRGGRAPLRTAPKGARRASPWALRREFRSTFRDTLTESERIVAGR